MTLDHLNLINFKNFSEQSFEFDPKINCLVGNNGVGKTNVLDAIYYLSNTKGYFHSIATHHIRHGANFFVIEGVYDKNGRGEHIHASLKKGSKKVFKRNDKDYEKLSEHFGLIPLVIISPSDSNLIQEGSELRRKFMDMIISMDDREYFQDLIRYNKVLSQRNSLLKYFALNFSFDQDTLDIYNEQMVEYGTNIYAKRQRFGNEFEPIFLKRYEHIVKRALSDDRQEEVQLVYRSQLLEESFEHLLQSSLEKDRVLQHSSVGIHRDDWQFLINGHPVKKIGSQGQQKSFLIALKLAQFDFIGTRTQSKPILLLDDIFDKLDDRRVAQLVELVNDEGFGQLFITDTHEERTTNLVKNTGQSYKVFQL